MSWIVYFVMLKLELPEGFSARFHAKFPDREACEQWVAEIEAKQADDFKIVSVCEPEKSTENTT